MIMRANMNEVIKPSKVNPLNYVSVVGVVLVLVLVFFSRYVITV